jgi:predicted membrane protein
MVSVAQLVERQVVVLVAVGSSPTTHPKSDSFFKGPSMNYFSLISGLFLILFGISIFLKELFGISIPLFKLILAIFLIYLGVSLILDMRIKDQRTIFFGHHTTRPHDTRTSSYQTMLGENTIDLTGLIYDRKPEILYISTIFGKTIIYLDPDIPTKIIAHSSFGEIQLPDGSTGTFGTTIYNSHPTNPELILKVRTTFGQTVAKQK